MITIGICDDNKEIRKKLKACVEGYKDNINVKCFSSGEELLKKNRAYENTFFRYTYERH